MGPRSLTWTHGHFDSGRGSGGTVCGASQTECVHLLTPRASGERREGHRGPFCRVVDAGRPPGPGSVWGTAARVLDRPGQYFNLMNDRLVEGQRPIFLNLKAQNCCEEDRSSLPPCTHPFGSRGPAVRLPSRSAPASPCSVFRKLGPPTRLLQALFPGSGPWVLFIIVIITGVEHTHTHTHKMNVSENSFRVHIRFFVWPVH